MAYPQRARLQRALDVVLAVNTAQVSQAALAQGRQGAEIGKAVDGARTQALQAWLKLQGQPGQQLDTDQQ